MSIGNDGILRLEVGAGSMLPIPRTMDTDPSITKKIQEAVRGVFKATVGIGNAELIRRMELRKVSNLPEMSHLCSDIRRGKEKSIFAAQIVELCARGNQDGWALAQRILRSGVDDPATRIEIAKVCVRQNGLRTAKYIQSFGITDQAVLIDIAKFYAQQDGGGTAQYIQNFGIKDPAALIEIAKLCAQQDGEGTAKYIQNFEIKDPAALFEIARICARQSGGGTAHYIQNLGIRDQASRIEIAKLCAQQDGLRTALYIHLFGIKDDQAALIKIAKLCAQQNGRGTALYIHLFGIKDDQATLVEIAKLCAQQDGEGTALFIKNFGIEDQEVLFNLGVFCLFHTPEAFKSKIPDLQQYFGGATDAFIERLSPVYNDAFNPNFIREGCSGFGDETGDFVLKNTGFGNNEEIIRALFFSCKLLGKMNELKRPAIQNLVIALMSFRVPALKPLLLQDLVEILSKKKESEFDAFRLTFTIPEKPQKKQLSYAFILTVFCAKNLDEPLKVRLVNDFLKSISRRDAFLTVASKTGALIELVRLLNDQIGEGSAQVYDEFVTYNSSQDFSQNLTIARAALAFGMNISGMKREEVKALVHQKIQLPERFDEVFEKLRGEGNLFIYAAKIQELGDEERTHVLGTLATYLQEVVDGTFYDRRYDLSPHLQKMKELYCAEHGEEAWGTLMDEWRKGQKVEGIGGARPENQAIDVKEFFQKKLDDGHFTKEKMPLLCGVLNGQQVSIDKGEGSKETLFDALCAKMVLQGRPTPQLIQKALNLADGELRNDLRGLLQRLKASSSDFSGYTVENTDNHWDLFLCGTEVVGSCQRVDGDPQRNKSLLGYVVDGKIRMIAVKDGSGRIVARSIIKLLWDAEQKKPVLFMEAVYSNNTKLNRTVEQMAKKEAERLGIDLVTEKTARGRKIQSYTNRSGFEYEDGGDAVQTMETDA